MAWFVDWWRRGFYSLDAQTVSVVIANPRMSFKTKYAAARRDFEIKIEATSMAQLVMGVVVIVLLFAIFYYVVSPFSQGIQSTLSTPQTKASTNEHVSFGNSIYFSVVTITTLGYGDFTPQGWSKILACVEVFFGLAMMGLIVAKLTSKRLSYHVRRLFSADAQRRLEEYATDFQRLQETFVILTAQIGKAFAETPGGTATPPRDDCRIQLSGVLRLAAKIVRG